MIGQVPLRQVKKCWRPIPILLTIKIEKKKKQTCKDFQEALEIKTRGATAPPKPEVTLINRVLTITVPQEKLIRYNHYFKVPARDYSIYKERYSELQTSKSQKPFK